ncbi:MAG: hypothetical protein COB26_01915 [Piscirickettsiaceae bacterium]|nr:MAG: hypothetical protein COB26_01915 [Piscirickettsiaceae bacterium]
MNLFKSMSIYTIVLGVNSMIPLLLLPVLTSCLSEGEYGLLSIMQIFIVLIMPFVSINICSYLRSEYHRVEREEFSILTSSIVTIPLVSVVVVSLIFIFLQPVINNFLDISLLWVMFIPLVALSQIVPQMVMAIFQISESPIRYGRYLLSLTALNILSSIALVTVAELGWEGRLIAIMLSNVIFTIIGISLLIKAKLFILRIEKKYVYSALKMGLPLIIHVISGALFMMSDRLFISYFLGNSEVGIYAVAAQVAMIVFVIQQAFNQSWSPYVFKNLEIGTHEKKVKIVKMSYIAFAIFLILPVAAHLLSYPVFEFLIDAKFAQSITYVFWISLGFGFLGMYKVVTIYIFYEKKIHILALMTFLSLVVNFILNYFLIQVYGAVGVAYATAMTLALFFMFAFTVACKVHKMPWLFFRERLSL